MKISELRNALQSLNEVNFMLPDGKFVPSHFHLTEIGLTSKQFIDCGGAIHSEKKANLQLWIALDLYHRLKPTKLIGIIDTALPLFEGDDLELEVEFETETVGKYGLSFDGTNFLLTATKTDCLAAELCGVGDVLGKAKVSLKELGKNASCCSPSSGCC